jgi:hypothetical protein
LLMPPGSVMRIHSMYEELKRLQAGSEMLGSKPNFSVPGPELGPDREYLEVLRHRYYELVHSASWTVTAPLRGVARLIRRQRRDPIYKVWQLTVADLEYLIRNIESSTSWRKTRWMRNYRRIFHN